MHHVKPTAKGDALCPLGFHPQVRWPTRCKRCYREYRDHGNRNKESDSQLRKNELTVSTPALSTSTRSKSESRVPENTLGSRSWTSSSNLSSSGVSSRASEQSYSPSNSSSLSSSSWSSSSPNLADVEKKGDETLTVSFTLPRRRPTLDTGQDEDDPRRTQYTVRRRTTTLSNLRSNYSNEPTEKTPSLSSNIPKRQSVDDNSKTKADFPPQVKNTASKPPLPKETKKSAPKAKTVVSSSDESDEDGSMVTAISGTSDATLVNEHESEEEIEQLKKELEALKARCERAEREKSDFMLRRLTSDTGSSRNSATEVLKLQQKVNELKTTVEDLQDDRKCLNQRLKETEVELKSVKATGMGRDLEALKEKLKTAQTMCEELLEENEDMKKEMKEMEEEMDEMQDKFREDRADEYTMLKKELEQATKNCRIVSFKLRKSERKTEQLEIEKFEMEQRCREVAGGQTGLDKMERIKQLEHDLSVANETAARLEKELDEVNRKSKSTDKDKGTSAVKKKAPKLGSVPKTPSSEKVSRESLTRGDSQEDPVQLLRDLQDSMEREADLREQLRFAEEEAEHLRKKSARLEDDNESLVLQLKKMATKARTRRHSPSQQRLTPEPVDKDEGISDEEDPSELRLLLELNEQEAAVLRKKTEELENEGDRLKRKVKELQEKLSAKANESNRRSLIQSAEPKKSNAVYEQKMKLLEEEMSELRKKLIEKDRECERLHAEISIGAKKPKTLQKSKSLDGDQQTLDLKRQLQVIETEASILRTKIQNLETENEKLLSENKKLSLLASKRAGSVERTHDAKTYAASLEKQLEESNKKIKELESTKKSANANDSKSTIAVGEIEKLKNQLKKAEADKKKNDEALKRLKEDALADVVKFYKSRKPKQPTDLTPKTQLKKMIEEDEKEIEEILVALHKSEEEKKKLSLTSSDNEKTLLKDELTETKMKLDRLIKEAKEESEKRDIELGRLNNMIKDLESDKLKIMRERDKTKTQLEKEAEKLKETKSNLEKQNKNFKEEIDKLKGAEKISINEVSNLKKEIEYITKTLTEEKKHSLELQEKLKSLSMTQTEYSKLKNEVGESNKKIQAFEKESKDTEEKLKKSEKLAATRKEKISKLEKEQSELKTKINNFEKEHDLLVSEKKGMKLKCEEAEQKLVTLKEELEAKNLEIKKMEKNALSDGKSSKDTTKEKQYEEKLNKANTEIKELKDKLKKAVDNLKITEEERKKKEKELQKELEDWETKASELEMDLQGSRKMMERLKANHEKEIKAKELELNQLRADALTSGQKKMTDVQRQMEEKIANLELALESEKNEYDELTSKYEELEEEHVVMKATLVKEKEKTQSQLVKAEKELEDIEKELKSLKEAYSVKHDYWMKEKKKSEDKNKDFETMSLENSRLQAISEEKQSEIDQLRKEIGCLTEQNDHIRKDNEELRKKIEDYHKLDKVQRTMNSDLPALEEELKECKKKLAMEEKAKKKELGILKMRYDKRIAIISEEVVSIQGQMSRFKKERDSYKHLLEAAQRNIADLKASGSVATRSSLHLDEWRNQIASLEQQISVLEDELSESRVEASKLRTELVSERSAWEVKLSELTSKLNEYEEDKILSSGRTRVSGTKTRMELAWHKEREEQHRLLQETSTLARDLRQTLFEVERERDRERLESKRRLEQLKKSNEEEQEEIRKKLNEMQCDLLELRDAHAKLRTTNEKLRREKDRLEKEREMLKQSMNIKKRVEQEEERQIISVAQLVEELTVLAPDLFPSKPRPPVTMPTPPARRKGPKSREASPALERKDYSRESSMGRDDTKSQEVQEILKRLTEAANELKKSQKEDRDSLRKAFGSFRSSSIESDGSVETSKYVKHRGLQRKPSLLRKSLSLEQTSAQEQQAIWTDDDKEGSVTSVQSLEEMEKFRQNLYRRDPSLDSRLSGGSTQSEVLPSSTEKKKKLGLFGKLKKLTKSKSIDQESEMGSMSQLDPGSDTSLNLVEERGSNRQFKDKLSGMFKKSGSSSRGNSLERNAKTPLPVKKADSTQRPLVSSGVSSDGPSASRPLVQKPPNTAPVQRKMKK